MVLKKRDTDYDFFDHDEPIVANLPFITMKVKEPVEYEVDFDKVKTLDDVINILKGMNIRYYQHPEDVAEVLKPYLRESDVK